MHKLSIFILITFLFHSCKNEIQKTPFEIQKELITSSPYANLNWRLIGPSFRSGRSTDVWGIKNDTNVIYAAFATGGLWKTEDAGKNWKPIFDKEATQSIGSIAVAQSDKNIVYVGTGEANIFRASLPGLGMYKTDDGGKTFRHIGLEKSGTIARVIIHPNDVNKVYVAVSGNEWTNNEDRGLYLTENGGLSWQKILFESSQSGCIDVVMDPSDPNILYASMWNRIRKRWSDPIPMDNDYIYKTQDGGKTWKKLTNGLPHTKMTGRIGLAIAKSNPNVIYAYVDDHNKKREPNKDEFDSYERKVQKVVIGAAIYRSDNKGETWVKQSEIHDFIKPFSGTYGWVFSQIRVNPSNENELFALGVNLAKSVDAGKKWIKIEPKEFIHGDNHGMWFDESNPSRILLANDGGVSITKNGGKTWKNFFDKIPTTQFYTVTYDLEKPFNIYGSVQDEGTLGGSSMITFGKTQDSLIKKWDYAPGGEGTQIRVDPTNSNIIYSSSYYGRLMRSDLRIKEDARSTKIPIFDVGRIDSLRAEWLAGTIISKYNSKVIYHGLQHLYKSSDEGNTWKKISHDLSFNDKSKMGNYPYLIYHQAITSIAEGNRPGHLYVGTDDGRIWKTKDDGNTWIEITQDLPSNKHVMSIIASVQKENYLFLALNDRRQDNNTPYIYHSKDDGDTWDKISSNLPSSPVNVVIEDPEETNTLLCGTDMGPYLSKNHGKTWFSLTANLPYSVSINDMFIHPRDKKLVIGTYGRGVWILDDYK